VLRIIFGPESEEETEAGRSYRMKSFTIRTAHLALFVPSNQGGRIRLGMQHVQMRYAYRNLMGKH
jgi:hypothetical protein